MSAVYPKYKEALLSGAANTSLTSGTVKVILVDTADYTYSAAHDFLDDVPAAAREEISAALTGKSVTDGLFDANDTSLPGATGDESEALIIFIDTGTEATSRLVAYIDSATGLPITLNGGDVNVVWDNGTNKIFQL